MKLRILIVHNGYQHKGGEDTVVESEFKLLQDNGHEVQLFTRHNDDIKQLGRLKLVANTFWSSDAAADFAAQLERFRPDIIHVHNTFPLISPAIYWIAARFNIPTIQTLHNFRLFCPQAMFLRNGRVCEDCLGHLPWRGAVRGCYRSSVLQSSVLASMVSAHRIIGTWQTKVTRYIALNNFCREKFIAGGLPKNKVVVKPNFVKSFHSLSIKNENFLFVGRLSPEKGISTLFDALKRKPNLNLSIAGSGNAAEDITIPSNVSFLGFKSKSEVFSLMASTLALVMPSIWYETFGLVIVEAFSVGTPVIASNIGVIPELVEDGVTGLLFEPGNADDLAAKLQWAADHPEQMKAMGDAARLKYEANYTAEHNYKQLIAIYNEAIMEVNGEGV